MFKERLRNARKAKNISQKELASQLFLSQQSYAKYEVGTATPNPETLAKIAIALDVSVDYLLGVDIKKDPAGAPSEAKKAMYDLIDTLSDEQISRLVVIAKAALAL